MLAAADASAGETMDEGRSAGRYGMTCGGPVAAAGVPVFDKGRGGTAVEPTEAAAAHDCSGPYATACICGSRTLAARAFKAGHPVPKNRHDGAATVDRVVTHTRGRVTRLLNGSILCWRDRPLTHILAVPWEANDDTASDGDDSSGDDDDSRNDLNGDDNTDSPVIAWLQALVLYLIAPDSAPATSWNSPSFHPFPRSQRLRC